MSVAGRSETMGSVLSRGQTTCVNCGAPDPQITGTDGTAVEIGPLFLSWVGGKSHYCDADCLIEAIEERRQEDD